MFLISTIIKKSTLLDAGLGAFAMEDIKKGQLVFEVKNPLLITIDELNSMPDALKKQIYHFMEIKDGKVHILFDNSNYVNHSIKYENIRNMGSNLSPILQPMIAIRDIYKGEELFSNYLLSIDKEYMIKSNEVLRES